MKMYVDAYLCWEFVHAHLHDLSVFFMFNQMMKIIYVNLNYKMCLITKPNTKRISYYKPQGFHLFPPDGSLVAPFRVVITLLLLLVLEVSMAVSFKTSSGNFPSF